MDTRAAASPAGNPLAAIDMGSNSFRLEIGQLPHGHLGRYRRVDYLKETVRLGAGLDAGGLLTEHGDGVAIAAFGAALLLIFFAGLSIWSLVVAGLLAVAGLWAMRASPAKASAER